MNKSICNRLQDTKNIVQKQLSVGVLRKRCSKNIQQIYRRTPVSKCDFNKVAFGMGVLLYIYWISSEHLFTRIPFYKKTYGVLLLVVLIQYLYQIYRSTHPKVFCKKVLKNFTKFTGKHLCWSLFFIKLEAGALQFYLKRDSGTSVFLWTLWNFFKKLFI